MSDDSSGKMPDSPPANEPVREPLSPQAERALAEAAARRTKCEQDGAAKLDAGQQPTEHQGPSGPEPTRFGDWERKGIASDF